MFTEEERRALDKIVQIDDIESRLANLLEDIKRNIRYPQEIFDEYVTKVKHDLEVREKRLRKKKTFFEKMLEENYEAIERLYQEKSQGFPWLAKAYADYSYLRDMKIADWMEKKKRPAKVSADIIREISRKKRDVERQFKVTKYFLDP